MNFSLQKEMDKIATLLDVTEYQMHQLSDLFYKDMENKTMLKMIPTYAYCNVEVPDGEYLTVDFGGTNIRCNRYEVKNKEIKLLQKVSTSLITEDKNYTTSEYSLEDIFNLIVDNLEKIIDKEKEYFLGHTFSFAARSLSKNSAVVIDMAKGFELRDAENVDVNELLIKIIKDRKLKIEPVSVINDTIATLLTGNYHNKNADIAVIMGTGHNSCFRSQTGKIINVESAFMKEGIPLSYYDFNLLEKMKDAKETVMEVLTGGKYLGLIAQEITDELFESGMINRKFEMTSEILSEAVNDNLSDKYSEDEKEILKQIGLVILKRASKLVVSELMAILRYIDEDLENKHLIVFDGSVYEKNKVLQDYIKLYLEKAYGENVKKLEVIHIKDASSIGAVISIFPLN